MTNFFETEEQQKAKNWDMLQQVKAEKAKIARLQNEIRVTLADIQKFAVAASTGESRFIRINGASIALIQHHPELQSPGCTVPEDEIMAIPSEHGGFQKVATLMEQINSSKRLLSQLVSELGDIGLTL